MKKLIMVNNKHLLENLTSDLAYWIGYISADGSIDKESRKLSFCIKSDDSILLEELKKYFDITNPIRHSAVFDKRTKKHYNRASLQICDSVFVKKLKVYNLTHEKSKDFFIPDCLLNPLYFFDFLRGLLDGDGHISISSGHPKLGFISTEKSIRQIQNFLKAHYNVPIRTIASKSKDINFEAYSITIYKDAVKIMGLIYENGYLLKRKYDKYIGCIQAEKSKGNSQVTRAVDIYDKGSNLLGSFNSLVSAANFLKISPSTLSNIISGQNPYSRDYVVVAKHYLKQKNFKDGITNFTEYTKKINAS